MRLVSTKSLKPFGAKKNLNAHKTLNSALCLTTQFPVVSVFPQDITQKSVEQPSIHSNHLLLIPQADTTILCQGHWHSKWSRRRKEESSAVIQIIMEMTRKPLTCLMRFWWFRRVHNSNIVHFSQAWGHILTYKSKRKAITAEFKSFWSKMTLLNMPKFFLFFLQWKLEACMKGITTSFSFFFFFAQQDHYTGHVRKLNASLHYRREL